MKITLNTLKPAKDQGFSRGRQPLSLEQKLLSGKMFAKNRDMHTDFLYFCMCQFEIYYNHHIRVKVWGDMTDTCTISYFSKGHS